MSHIAPWLSLAIDWQDSEMFDPLLEHGIPEPATMGERLAWICLLCHAKSKGRAGRVLLRKSALQRDYRLTGRAVDGMLKRAQKCGAIEIAENVVTLLNWRTYQDKGYKGKTTILPESGEMSENSTTHHPSPTTHHPPPPPTPKPPTDPEWAGVEEFLFSLGLLKAAQVVAMAMANGCTPTHARNVAEFWRSNQPAWRLGALCDRIEKLRPGQSVTDLWPEPDGKVTKQKQRDDATARAADARKANDEGKRRKQADDEAAAIREREYGPRLDAMPKATVEKFIRERWPDNAAFYVGRLTNGKPDGLLRRQLLEALEQTAELDS